MIDEGVAPPTDAEAVAPLSSDEAVRVLTDAGLMPDGASEDSFSKVEIMRRNRSVHLRLPDGSGYVLKRSRIPGRPDMANEAAVLRALATDDAVAASRVAADLLAYDAARGVLVTRLVGDSVDLRSIMNSPRPIPRWIGARIGQSLAWLHRRSPRRWKGSDGVRQIDPFALRLHRPTLREYAGLSAGNIQLIRIVQASPALMETLEELRLGWWPATLIHADIRMDNVVVRTRRGHRDLRLVDWELAGLGDPAWDVGSALGMFVEAWIGSIPFVGGPEDVDAGVAAAGRPIASLHRVIGDLWSAYAKAYGIAGAPDWLDPPEGLFLQRCVRFAALRLLQTAFEASTATMELAGHHVLLAQVAENIAEAPDAAPVGLLGMPPRGVGPRFPGTESMRQRFEPGAPDGLGDYLSGAP